MNAEGERRGRDQHATVFEHATHLGHHSRGVLHVLEYVHVEQGLKRRFFEPWRFAVVVEVGLVLAPGGVGQGESPLVLDTDVLADAGREQIDARLLSAAHVEHPPRASGAALGSTRHCQLRYMSTKSAGTRMGAPCPALAALGSP